MKNGLSAHKAYNAKYSGQMEDIIKKLFASKKADRNKYNPATDPKNWNMTQNIVIGGVNHQHPHCDQGKAGAFLNESVFPFVAIHGFGVHDFEVWLLPAKNKQREYGFLAKLDKNQFCSYVVISFTPGVICRRVGLTLNFFLSNRRDGRIRTLIGDQHALKNGRKSKTPSWCRIYAPIPLGIQNFPSKMRKDTKLLRTLLTLRQKL